MRLDQATTRVTAANDADNVIYVVNFSDDISYTDPDFPTSGDGLFTVKDYPDEVFLNPNTFSTYDETQGDYWVGNITENDSTSYTRTVADSEINDRRTALTYCVNYAMDEIVDGGGGTNNTYTTNTTYSSWQNVQRTDNLLIIMLRLSMVIKRK
ncbi:hypothetical protein [Phocaeicola abscessus]|uniref:hypothetical protein n=1 Tax=Phocaeicola abscessus TaxID=555313 RepID=UPI0028ED2D1C|nr:hypothetical protein [Phocaeicola abscessus]